MLTVDSSERITPSQILQHPFTTMSHLVGTFDNSPHVKSSVELTKYCDVLSSDDGKETISNSPALHPDEGHAAGQSEEEQLGLQSIRGNSPAKKRKRDCSEDSESGNRSRIATKRRRSQCQDAADTVRQTRPLLRKRQRDESDQRSSSDSNSQKTKKRHINLDKEPMDSVTELLSDTQEAPSSSTQVQSRKRKRSNEEATSPEEEKTSCSDKRRRRRRRRRRSEARHQTDEVISLQSDSTLTNPN